MKKRELARLLRENVTPERKRATAYHEAGHAALQFMFGNAGSIEHVNMRGNYGVHAFVRSRPSNILSWAQEIPRSGSLRAVFLLQAKQHVMHQLAGFAAQNRLSPTDYESWLDEQIDMIGWEWNDENENDGHDMAVALRTAKVLWGDNGNAWRFLRQMASWTDEALSHPKLWGVVQSLAENLVTINTRMSGGRACDIMDKAWGNGAMLRYMDMGRKWRRRFSITTKGGDV